MNNSYNDLLQSLTNFRTTNVFKKYINYIRFPQYKNLEPNTKITFDFPLTVFVGQNGTGKSSVLQALYGSPVNNSVGKYWFSTELDPIFIDNRPALIYEYNNSSGIPVEVIKTRIKKKFIYKYKYRGESKEIEYYDVDYWEPSRPIISYEMKPVPEGKRNPAIEKNVVYLDFRSELSTFDQYMYFKEPRKTKKRHSKQDFLREQSKYLFQIFKLHNNINSEKKFKNDPQIILDKSQLNIISNILGKKFISCKIVYHNFYNEWCWSVYFTTENLNYSEAFAGSGEYAVVRLVYEIIKAPQESLILLDEPEVSLHPGAQEKLKCFLLEQIKLKKHQIIISTHSPTLIKGLPPNAIKVFSQTPSGKFHIDNERTPEEAFHFIGYQNPNKKTIYTEDKLAKELVESVINTLDNAKSSLFEVIAFPSGKDSMKKHISTFAFSSNQNTFFYFDGDVKTEHFCVSYLKESDRNIDSLKNIIRTQTQCEFSTLSIPMNGSDSKTEDDIKLLIDYLKFYKSNVFYLPRKTPEEIIWDDNVLQNEDIEDKIKEGIKNILDYKEKFQILCSKIYGKDSSSFIFVLQNKYLRKWIEKKDASFQEVINVLNLLISK